MDCRDMHDLWFMWWRNNRWFTGYWWIMWLSPMNRWRPRFLWPFSRVTSFYFVSGCRSRQFWSVFDIFATSFSLDCNSDVLFREFQNCNGFSISYIPHWNWVYNIQFVVDLTKFRIINRVDGLLTWSFFQAGLPLMTSATMIDVFPVNAAGLSLPPEIEKPNP